MAIDFYKTSDRHKVLFSINDDDFESLTDVFEEYKRLTGITIDQYGTTRISHGHIQVIIKLLAAHLKQQKYVSNGLIILHTKLSNITEDIIAVGD